MDERCDGWTFFLNSILLSFGVCGPSMSNVALLECGGTYSRLSIIRYVYTEYTRGIELVGWWDMGLAAVELTDGVGTTRCVVILLRRLILKLSLYFFSRPYFLECCSSCVDTCVDDTLLEEMDTTDLGPQSMFAESSHYPTKIWDKWYPYQRKRSHCRISPGPRLAIINGITRPAPTTKVSPHPSLADKGSPKSAVKIPARKPSIANAKL